MTEPMSPDDRTQLAAEYALRILEGKDLARARALVADDPEFRAEVAAWSGRFAPLLDEVSPLAPPDRLLGAIERRIGDPAEAGSNVYQLRRRVSLWRGLTAAATAIAASLAVVLVTRPAPIERVPVARAPAAPLVALVASEDGASRLVATWDPAAESLVIAAAAGAEAQPEHVHELWVIPADGTPRSIGLLRRAAPTHLRIGGPLADQIALGATLAISIEPLGGSPTGAPTGPVIATGKLEQT